MAETTRTDAAPEELAYRANDGVEVSLFWSRETNHLSVSVADAKSGDWFELVVEDGTNPLDVFHHPYAFAAFRGVDYRGGVRRTGETVYA